MHDVRHALTLVAGGAGFIGSHLCRALLDQGHHVVCLDNLQTGRESIVRKPLPVDDPRRRRPDISRAQALLGWHPHTPLGQGLRYTRDWFAEELRTDAAPVHDEHMARLSPERRSHHAA